MLTFHALAERFEQLEATASRTQMVNVLADLFGQVSADEVGEVAYLLQGRVAPQFEPVEFGLGDKSVATAVGQAYGVDRTEVLARYARAGDLGKVAQQLAAEHKVRGEADLSIREVFAELRRVAHLAGPGSTEQKVTGLVHLLARVDPAAAKHLVRIPLGTARLGIGDVTILAAFAQAKAGDPKQRKVLEEAYNRTSDLGLIGQTLWQDGLEAAQQLDVTVGRPIRPQLAERLPSASAILEKFGGQAHAQWKFDGMRVQIHLDRSRPAGDQVRLFSRNLENMTHMFPELVDGVLRQVKADLAVLDAEALAYNPASEEFLPFQVTTRRRRKHKVAEMQAELPLRGMVFDLMYRDGQPLLDVPLTERLELLVQTVSGDDPLRAERGQVVDAADRLQALFDEALSLGLEGLVTKRLESTYQAGARNFNWVKLKKHSGGALQDTLDCVLLGYIYGRGKRAELGVGALLVGVYDQAADEFVTVTKIGTGLSDDQWRDIRARGETYVREEKPARVQSLITPSVWVEPELVIEVLADEITRSPVHTAGRRDDQSGYALRFPRFVRLREADKRPEDATTVDELVELYRMQGTRGV